MHNIGVCYERLEKFTAALKWFKRASQIAPNKHFTFRGATINFFKLGKYQQASDFVRAAISEVKKEKIEKFGSLDHIETEDAEPYDRDSSKSYQATLNDYNHILAMCLRKLHLFEEAGELYLKNAQFYRYKERKSMV